MRRVGERPLKERVCSASRLVFCLSQVRDFAQKESQM
jgi:hypothetical protein